MKNIAVVGTGYVGLVTLVLAGVAVRRLWSRSPDAAGEITGKLAGPLVRLWTCAGICGLLLSVMSTSMM